MDTSLWSPARIFASLLWGSSDYGSACGLDEFPSMLVGADCADDSWLRQSSSHCNDTKVTDARIPEAFVADPADSTTLIWNAMRLIMACSTFQTFVRAADEHELLSAQLRAGLEKGDASNNQ